MNWFLRSRLERDAVLVEPIAHRNDRSSFFGFYQLIGEADKAIDTGYPRRDERNGDVGGETDCILDIEVSFKTGILRFLGVLPSFEKFDGEVPGVGFWSE